MMDTVDSSAFGDRSEISAEELLRVVGTNEPKYGENVPKPSKYRNIKCEADGHKFDSLKERERYFELKRLQENGHISTLRLQQRFEVKINDKHICFYIADFTYIERLTAAFVVEDVKSEITRKKETYRLKKKLVEAYHGITIHEV